MPFSDTNLVDFDSLRVLNLLLETRSVTRTAEKAGVSQPAISRALARLRRRFDDALLIRSGGGMTLTPRAEALREPLGQWLCQGEALLNQQPFDSRRTRRNFHIASTDFGMLAVIAPALKRLSSLAPNLTLTIEPLTPDSGRKLAGGELDVIVTGYDPDESAVHARRLFSETFQGLARKDHPALGEGETIDLETYLAWPHIVVTVADRQGAPIERKLPPGMKQQAILSTSEFSAAPYMVQECDAFVTLPRRAAERFSALHGLQTFTPPLDLGTFDYWLVWHERSNRDPATRWVMDQLAETFIGAEEMGAG